MRRIVSEMKAAIMMTVMIGVICCGIYPAVVWAIAQGLFNDRANGSLISDGSRTVGSRLLAQGFSNVEYFQPRPSSAGTGYDAANSGGSNLGPLSKKLIDSVGKRANAYRRINGLAADAPVPADAVTTSASGLDPDISLENALLQSERVAKARGLSEETVKKAIDKNTRGRQLGVFGEPRVNVLMLNIELDRRAKAYGNEQR